MSIITPRPGKRIEREGGTFRKVTAIVRMSVLENVEAKLRAINVPGVCITHVKGFGEYVNFFTRNWMGDHARLEIYCTRQRADDIARAIMSVAGTGGPGDGIVAVLPVEMIYRIRTGKQATAAEMGGT